MLRKTLTVVATLLVICTVAYAVYEQIVYGPTAKAKVPELQAEAEAIPFPPEDVLVNQLAPHKSHHALVDRTYTSRLTYSQLRAHYDAELSRRGWQFTREKPVRDWGRDLGGKDACYRKGEDVASLFFAGERASYGWTYSISFSWGLSQCKP